MSKVGVCGDLEESWGMNNLALGKINIECKMKLIM